jgi:hypothetical protein
MAVMTGSLERRERLTSADQLIRGPRKSRVSGADESHREVNRDQARGIAS